MVHKVNKKLLIEMKEFLNYNKKTGVFIWKKTRNGMCEKGNIAGCLSEGYVLIKFNFKTYRSARLAWIFFYGVNPKYQIDHINGIKNDDRICNLRDVKSYLNSQNIKKPRCDNTTGYIGVIARRDGFDARIKNKGKNYHIGHFKSAKKAGMAYIKAKRRLHKTCTI